MKIIQNEIPVNKIPFVEPSIIPDNALFFDIETTGFSARSSYLYLVGCALKKGEYINIVQYLAENRTEEEVLLTSFFEYASGTDKYISFNGDQFDIPYLLEKAKKFNIDSKDMFLNSYDIYKEVKPYKNILSLANLKQKTIEGFLKIDRDDKYSGGELINVFFNYEKTKEKADEHLLLLHNYEDVLGMIKLISITKYFNALTNDFEFKKTETVTSKDYYGNEVTELIIRCKLKYALPSSVRYRKEYISLYVEDDNLVISTPIENGLCKYPHLDIKNYVYLKNEDMAILKEMATFVDKDSKEKATYSNCYSKFNASNDILNDSASMKKYVETALMFLKTK